MDEPRWAKAPTVDPRNPAFLINDEESWRMPRRGGGAMSSVRNPVWPKGMTLQQWLATVPSANGECRFCFRRVVPGLVEHDGMCPVPFLEAAQACIEALERVRLAAQDVANTWRQAEDQPYVTENEAEDALVAALAMASKGSDREETP